MQTHKNRNQRSCVLIERKHNHTDTVSPEKSLNAFLSPSLCGVCDTGGDGVTLVQKNGLGTNDPGDY